MNFLRYLLPRVWGLSVAAACTMLCSTAFASSETYTLKVDEGKLFGTLLLPEQKAPSIVVMIVPGSGATDRNGNGRGEIRPATYRLLSEALLKHGIGSLLIDKRGVGDSAGAAVAEYRLTLETFVGDVERWVEKLKNDPRVDKVVLFGHSEGGLISILAAQHLHDQIDKIILASTSGTDAATLMQKQAEGLPEKLAQDSKRILASLRKGHFINDFPAELDSLYRLPVQPYLMSWIKYDPVMEIKKIALPVLVLHGEADIQVPSNDALILSSSTKKALVRTFPGMTHTLKDLSPGETNQNSAYTDGRRPVSDGLVQAVVQFVRCGNLLKQ